MSSQCLLLLAILKSQVSQCFGVIGLFSFIFLSFISIIFFAGGAGMSYLWKKSRDAGENFEINVWKIYFVGCLIGCCMITIFFGILSNIIVWALCEAALGILGFLLYTYVKERRDILEKDKLEKQAERTQNL